VAALFVSRIKELRKLSNETQEEVADKVGVNRSTYSGYEQGVREPDFETLIRIAAHFKATTDYLLGVTDTQFERYILTRDEIDYLEKSLEVYRGIKIKYKI
jgi:transcriptional regulator with XRE-family HTH domain